MATINPNQDYDCIHTLSFNTDTGNCKIRLYRGSTSEFSGTVYYRAGTSGEWTELSVSGTTTTFPISSTTMQVAHDWNKDGNNYMTASFYGATNLTGIAISQKAVLSGAMGNYFMYYYAYNCSSLTSLGVPDTSGLTSVDDNFMRYYAYGCSNLTSLGIPDTSGLTSVGTYFMASYASGCAALTSLSVPDTSGLTSVGNAFMYYYAYGCSALTSLAVPDTSGLTSVGSYFMTYYAYGCNSLTELVLPKVGWFATHDVNWHVPSSRLGILQGVVLDSADLAGWQALTAPGKTLYINYIRDADDVLVLIRLPTVITQLATLIGSTSARINGKVTFDGYEPCEARFRYRKVGDQTWIETNWQNSLITDALFHVDLTNLEQATRYEYQVQARNSAGTSDWTSSAYFVTLMIKITNETIGITESAVRGRRSIRTIVETLSIQDSYLKRNRSRRIADETMRITESSAKRNQSIRTINETVSITDTATRCYYFTRIINETISILDTANWGWYITKIMNETISIAEAVARKSHFIKVINEVVSILESTIHTQKMVKVMNETLRILDTASKKLLSTRIMNETINIIDRAGFLPLRNLIIIAFTTLHHRVLAFTTKHCKLKVFTSFMHKLHTFTGR